MRIKRLSPETFDLVVAETRLGAQSRDMARAVLVEGRAQVDVADEHRTSKQRVNVAVATVRSAYLKRATPGGSSIRFELELPEALAQELCALAEALAHCRSNERRSAVIEDVQLVARKGRLSLL